MCLILKAGGQAMKVIILNRGVISYELRNASVKHAYSVVKALYMRYPEATIYLDRGEGGEFVDRHVLKGYKAASLASLKLKPFGLLQ